MAKRPTTASVQRAHKQSIVSTMKKAFGDDENVHIKELSLIHI